jgi:glycosyltransferase involved in cell wall biosynthesis
MDRANRVLVVSEFPQCNGGENSLLAIIPTLQARGWQFEVIAPDGPFAEQVARVGCRHHPIRWQKAGSSLPLEERRGLFARWLSELTPTLVHANSLAMARLTGPVCQEQQIPSVGYLRDIIRLSARARGDTYCHRRLIAVSNATRSFHVNEGMPGEKITVVHNGIKSRPTERRENTERNATIRIGGVGQIGLRKGWDQLVSAAEILAKEKNSIAWEIAGTRHSDKEETVVWEQELRRRTAAPALRANFIWRDRIDSMESFYQSIDLLVHPARQEPLGRTLLEAANFRIPIVATDVGGTSELFPAISGTAILCPAESPDALAAAVRRLIASPQQARAMAERAKRRIETVFTLERCADATERVYREVIESELGPT